MSICIFPLTSLNSHGGSGCHLACGKSRFDPRSPQTSFVNAGSDNSTAKRSATVCNGSLEIPRFTAATLYDTLNDDHECRANDLHLLQRRIHMGENLPSWTVIPKQTKILQ